MCGRFAREVGSVKTDRFERVRFRLENSNTGFAVGADVEDIAVQQDQYGLPCSCRVV